MSDRLLLVEKLDVEYGDQIFGSYDIEGIQKYLEKLRAFGVNSWEASEIYAGLMIAFEIDADDFSAFYKSYIQSMQYQEDREEEEGLSEEERESLCGEPTCIHYSYYYNKSEDKEYSNFEIETLLEKIQESKSLIGRYANLIDEAKQKAMQSEDEIERENGKKRLKAEEYIHKLKILSKLVEARVLRETTAQRYEDILFDIANLLSFKNDIKDIQPICEAAMGSKILSKLLESGECVFEGEI